MMIEFKVYPCKVYPILPLSMYEHVLTLSFIEYFGCQILLLPKLWVLLTQK